MAGKFKVGDVVVVKSTGAIKVIDEVVATLQGSRCRNVYTTKREGRYDWAQSFYSYQIDKLKRLEYEEMM